MHALAERHCRLTIDHHLDFSNVIKDAARCNNGVMEKPIERDLSVRREAA